MRAAARVVGFFDKEIYDAVVFGYECLGVIMELGKNRGGAGIGFRARAEKFAVDCTAGGCVQKDAHGLLHLVEIFLAIAKLGEGRSTKHEGGERR